MSSVFESLLKVHLSKFLEGWVEVVEVEVMVVVVVVVEETEDGREEMVEDDDDCENGDEEDSWVVTIGIVELFLTIVSVWNNFDSDFESRFCLSWADFNKLIELFSGALETGLFTDNEARVVLGFHWCFLEAAKRIIK